MLFFDVDVWEPILEYLTQEMKVNSPLYKDTLINHFMTDFIRVENEP